MKYRQRETFSYPDHHLPVLNIISSFALLVNRKSFILLDAPLRSLKLFCRGPLFWMETVGAGVENGKLDSHSRQMERTARDRALIRQQLVLLHLVRSETPGAIFGSANQLQTASDESDHCITKDRRATKPVS